MGVSCIQRSCSIVMAYAHSVMYTSIRACFLYFFYNPYMSLLIQRIFHLLVYIHTCMHNVQLHVCVYRWHIRLQPSLLHESSYVHTLPAHNARMPPAEIHQRCIYPTLTVHIHMKWCVCVCVCVCVYYRLLASMPARALFFHSSVT